LKDSTLWAGFLHDNEGLEPSALKVGLNLKRLKLLNRRMSYTNPQVVNTDP
jgi:hypothetical protein